MAATFVTKHHNGRTVYVMYLWAGPLMPVWAEITASSMCHLYVDHILSNAAQRTKSHTNTWVKWSFLRGLLWGMATSLARKAQHCFRCSGRIHSHFHQVVAPVNDEHTENWAQWMAGTLGGTLHTPLPCASCPVSGCALPHHCIRRLLGAIFW